MGWIFGFNGGEIQFFFIYFISSVFFIYIGEIIVLLLVVIRFNIIGKIG